MVKTDDKTTPKSNSTFPMTTNTAQYAPESISYNPLIFNGFGVELFGSVFVDIGSSSPRSGLYTPVNHDNEIVVDAVSTWDTGGNQRIMKSMYAIPTKDGVFC